MFLILVTYGNSWPDHVWARNIPTIENASALRKAAVDHDFIDARIVCENHFKALCDEKAKRRAAAAKAT